MPSGARAINPWRWKVTSDKCRHVVDEVPFCPGENNALLNEDGDIVDVDTTQAITSSMVRLRHDW